MLQFLKSLFSSAEVQSRPGLPAGQRVYAVGDVHGRLDLFEALIRAIEEDDAVQAPAQTTVVLLGDLVDRGPDSAGVVRRARRWQNERKVHILCGNHEEMFLRSFENTDMMRHFLRHGGKQTVFSYGVDRNAFTVVSLEEAQHLLQQAVPQEERDFIASFEDKVAIGDYVFVHAGIDPEVPLDAQRAQDMRWIREPFLSHSEPYGVVVVHGHTITEAPEDRGNRIGIDTGAYASGLLTALVLEGTERAYIQVSQDDGGNISVRPRAVAG